MIPNGMVPSQGDSAPQITSNSASGEQIPGERKSGVSEAPSPCLDGRWVVGGVFAEGGMAHVHIGCERQDPSRRVAIKRLHPQYAHNPDFVTMFGDEVRITARVRHPKVVSTLDVVRGENELFLVLEYVEGVTLAELRSLQGGALPVRPLVAIVRDVLEGLHAAHEATDELGRKLGVVHRDISPQNVIVGVDGVARVLDFGIAKAMGRFYETRGGQTKGKLAYFAPEQLRGEAVDRRTDVYTTAVLLWEFLADRRLFKGRNQAETLENIRGLQVPRPSEVTTRTDPDELAILTALDEVVLRGLARDPAERFPDAASFGEALLAHVAAEPSMVAAWVRGLAGPALAEKSRLIERLLSRDVIGDQATDEPEPQSLRRGDGPHPIRALVAASSEGGASDEDAASRESNSPIISPLPPAEPPPPEGDKSNSWWQKAVQGVRRPGWFWVILLLPSTSVITWLTTRHHEPIAAVQVSVTPARRDPSCEAAGAAPFADIRGRSAAFTPGAAGNMMGPVTNPQSPWASAPSDDARGPLGADVAPPSADGAHVSESTPRPAPVRRGLPRHTTPPSVRTEGPRQTQRSSPTNPSTGSGGAGAARSKPFRPQPAAW